MYSDLPLEKRIFGKDDMTALAESEIPEKNQEAEHFLNDSQELMLKAQKDAEIAKAVARQAISQAFQQSEAAIKRAEVLASAFDDVLEGSFGQTDHNENESDAEPAGHESMKSNRVKKLLNNGQNPLNAISDVTRSIFNNKAVDAETRMDFFNLVIRQSKQLRELVDDLVRQQAQKEIDKAIEEAKSDRIASKLAVQQTQDEVRKAREEAEKARNEAEASRKDAEEAISIARQWIEQAKDEAAAGKRTADVKLSQAQQQAMGKAQAEIKKAKDEVAAAKEAAGIAIKRAEAEALRSRREAEEARTAILESQQAVESAQTESRKAIEKAESAQRQIQEAVIQAQQQSYQDLCQEMNRIKAEAEATRKSACESIARAQEESRKAKEEAAMVKKDAEEALGHAREETRKAREEAEKARQTLAEVVARTQEECRKAKEEAEASILMANETMKLARQDIIGMTIDEITRTRRELEAASKKPSVMRDITPKLENRAVEETSNPRKETSPDNKETISPHQIITEAVQSAEGTALPKNNLIILSIPGTLPAIEADGTRIRQVLLSLITNAIQLSRENNAINVRAEVRDNELLIQVKDHGTGIPPAEISDVFEEYYQATSRGDANGPGPGLHICRQIIEAHGGRIWAESAEGQGSTFSFTLPLIPESH